VHQVGYLPELYENAWSEKYKIEQDVWQCAFQTGSRSNPIYYQMFFLNTFPKKASIRNIITIIWIYYTIIINIINNNAIINNNCGMFKDLILLFKIAKGTRKNFFEIHRKFGHMPSKRFACPPIVRRHSTRSRPQRVTEVY